MSLTSWFQTLYNISRVNEKIRPQVIEVLKSAKKRYQQIEPIINTFVQENVKTYVQSVLFLLACLTRQKHVHCVGKGELLKQLLKINEMKTSVASLSCEIAANEYLLVSVLYSKMVIRNLSVKTLRFNDLLLSLKHATVETAPAGLPPLQYHCMMQVAFVSNPPSLIKRLVLQRSKPQLFVMFNMFMLFVMWSRRKLPVQNESGLLENAIKLQKWRVLPCLQLEKLRSLLTGGFKTLSRRSIQVNVVSYNSNSNLSDAFEKLFCTLYNSNRKNPLEFPDVICFQEITNDLQNVDTVSYDLSSLKLQIQITKTSPHTFTAKFTVSKKRKRGSDAKKGSPRLDLILGANPKPMVWNEAILPTYHGVIAHQSAGLKMTQNTFKNLVILTKNDIEVEQLGYYAIQRFITKEQAKRLHTFFKWYCASYYHYWVDTTSTTKSDKLQEVIDFLKLKPSLSEKFVSSIVDSLDKSTSILSEDKKMLLRDYLIMTPSSQQAIVTRFALLNERLENTEFHKYIYSLLNEYLTHANLALFFPQQIDGSNAVVEKKDFLIPWEISDSDDVKIDIRSQLFIRGILTVELKIKNFTFGVATIHNTNNRYNYSPLIYYLTELQNNIFKNMPFILIGDMNIDGIDIQKKEELNTFLSSANLVVKQSVAPTHSAKWLDFLIHNSTKISVSELSSLRVGSSSTYMNCTARAKLRARVLQKLPSFRGKYYSDHSVFSSNIVLKK
jgi:hypothetical protein